MVTSANHKEIGCFQEGNKQPTTRTPHPNTPRESAALSFRLNLTMSLGSVAKSMQFADFGSGLEELFEKYLKF